ncbi:hypothetical protein DdX_20664 [Ditylenchus destructor]|uniref:Uncharacterized protein n=1 Tax=Ditylenchus destructor TaxID=166010 RepID=A0AAD4MGU9_9BILA|nr:hypothetical protein DdX_20664 [Ditylenchus destructor]
MKVCVPLGPAPVSKEEGTLNLRTIKLIFGAFLRPLFRDRKKTTHYVRVLENFLEIHCFVIPTEIFGTWGFSAVGITEMLTT